MRAPLRRMTGPKTERFAPSPTYARQQPRSARRSIPLSDSLAGNGAGPGRRNSRRLIRLSTEHHLFLGAGPGRAWLQPGRKLGLLVAASRFELGLGQAERAGQIDAFQACAEHACMGEPGASQRGLGQGGARQARTRQVRAIQIRSDRLPHRPCAIGARGTSPCRRSR